ncbi:hypothetical protein N7489_000766 [Penicillium chrysogenum]|uniref:Uncharacterized protein n=1 Tax=Penicillium chrysogenum TaxID=5076 RepID=A0ABQ8WGX7_PENCH|nr:uncharacterized protein N7489_000766 [Penicillium chrysogenum]KAJ5250356.1 hypothetical protein N7489_000766 [Penicillium chrysogenum]KAJ5265969.1 hypothetical protein N7524_006987 [Penicillium chrysogenum]KAJ5269259.1 hypothetical protein N7505_005017 [Penicillium chrysogenum]
MKESGLAFFGSPFSGLAEGQRLCSNLMRVPPDDPQIPSTKVQDPTADLADGVCGSATWGEDHRVFGVFRYAPATGRKPHTGSVTIGNQDRHSGCPTQAAARYHIRVLLGVNIGDINDPRAADDLIDAGYSVAV